MLFLSGGNSTIHRLLINRYGNYNRRGNDRGGFNDHQQETRPPPAPVHGKYHFPHSLFYGPLIPNLSVLRGETKSTSLSFQMNLSVQNWY